MSKQDWKKTRIDGKVILITGASAGLGKASAIDLARRGGKIYMLGRSKERTEAAAQDVIAESNVDPAMVQVMVVDLASLQSVRDFAAAFKQKEPKIDVLMNNAGIMMVPEGKTADGFELQFGTNVLGPFLLTHLLMEQLVAAAPGSRIVNLSSHAHFSGKKDMQWDDLMFEKNYNAMDPYCHSKLGDVLFNLELSKRVKASGISCYAVHPGIVKTNLQSGVQGWLGSAMRWFRPFMKSAANGAQTQVMCAIDPAIEGETGHYYADCKRTPASAQAQNKESATKLWGICAEMVKLQPDEIHTILT